MLSDKDTLLLEEHNVIKGRKGGFYYNETFYDTIDELKAAISDGQNITDYSPSRIDFLISTTPTIYEREIIQTLGLVSSDCAYGMNIFRDIFSAIRDVVGGRSKATEDVLSNAKYRVKLEMVNQAKELGADAIVGVDFDFNELDGGGKNGMLLVSGTGTAVKLKDTE